MAGLQSIPRDLLEAAAIDGANRVQRFARVTFPLLSPYTFFLLVTNVTYSFFNIFGAVDNLTQGGPWRQAATGGDAVGATNVLIYKVYRDAFEYRQISDAATQSLVLFLIVAGITILQFRFIEGRVTYGGEG
jgi:sn-glycerol 3-phosphate transport system permease protein